MINPAYLLKVSLCLLVFYGLYLVLFRKNTFFGVNRGYLLVALAGALFIPFVTFDLGIKTETSFTEMTEAYEYFHDWEVSNESETQTVAYEKKFDSLFWLSLLYWVGVAVGLLRFAFAFGKLAKWVYRGQKSRKTGYVQVVNPAVESPCSFFNFMLLPAHPAFERQSEWVEAHEFGHIRLGHTFDLIVVELFTAFFWFNPVLHFYKKALRLLHEYQADAFAMKRKEASAYLNALLELTFRKNQISLASAFHSSIKKRILMINYKKSKWNRGLLYSLTLPAVSLLVFFFSGKKNEPVPRVAAIGEVLTFETYAPFTVQEPNKPIGIPIDEKQLNKKTSKFGERMNPFTKKKSFHSGVDYSAPTGTPIRATASGKVIFAKNNGAFGNQVNIQHDQTYSTRYMHMDSYVVKSGETVKKGQVIGYVGSTGKSTGPHLHYEVRENGEPVDPDKFSGC